jgi:hypothetical protein
MRSDSRRRSLFAPCQTVLSPHRNMPLCPARVAAKYFWRVREKSSTPRRQVPSAGCRWRTTPSTGSWSKQIVVIQDCPYKQHLERLNAALPRLMCARACMCRASARVSTAACLLRALLLVAGCVSTAACCWQAIPSPRASFTLSCRNKHCWRRASNRRC